MPLKKLASELKNKSIKIIFTDYFDTIVHRNMHPNYALRLWAKLMIRELGLPISIDELYFIRLDSVNYLASKLEKANIELPYDLIIEQVYDRLVTNDLMQGHDKSTFEDIFQQIDIRVETNVQYLNNDVIKFLTDFKENGGKIYLISDFYLPNHIFLKLLQHHKIQNLFDGVYSSASVGKCKEKSTIYEHIIALHSINPSEVLMIGDNKNSDVINSQKSGLHSFLLPHGKYLRRNKRNRLGNDKKQLEAIIHDVYSKCRNNKTLPYTEYILFYHFFIERLYNKAKKDRVQDLFFLSREGQFLKKLFDSYQENKHLPGTHFIKTHYLKISRQAALQVNLKNLRVEEFVYLKKNYPSISLHSFLTHFNCPEKTKNAIFKDLNVDGNIVIKNFFTSDEFTRLKNNHQFISFYDNHRDLNHSEFSNYISSFGTNINENGIHLVDIGWRGTMQEAIFEFFGEQLPVTGYYLGIREISNIKEKTKRFGLLFSIWPYTSYNDYILLANTQLYEQFSAASHGSAVCYTSEANGYVLENYKTEEKSLYNNYIKEHQQLMFEHHLKLLDQLENVCYDQNMVQDILSDKALSTGLFLNVKKLKFFNVLSASFFQNIGANTVGISYESKKSEILGYLKLFILTPEVMFREMVKLKPVLYQKNNVLAYLVPSYLIFASYKINKYLRFRILNKYGLLKYQLFKNHKQL